MTEPTAVSKEQMLFNMDRIKRHVPFDVWEAIRALILSQREPPKENNNG
jgi:hypothetical protein